LATHTCLRVNGDVTVHTGASEDCEICSNLARLGLLADSSESLADRLVAEAQAARAPGSTDSEVRALLHEFGAALSRAGFVPDSIKKVVELLPPLLGDAGNAYRQELHEQILELIGYLGGKLMDEFLPQPGELDIDKSYDVGFQTGVASAFMIASAGTTHLDSLTNPDNYRKVRGEALRAASEGKLQEALLEEDGTVKEPE